MFKPLAFRFLLVIVLLAGVETALRVGLWNRFVLPNSHAGTTIRALSAWSTQGDPSVDTVTLGSSRPEYALDHVALAALAQKHGQRHLSFAMPGAHMLTIDTVSSWLKQNRPDVKNRVVALSVLDFTWAANGEYELGIVAPMGASIDGERLQQRLPLKTDSNTWGAVSALWRYRQDMRDAIFAPKQRLNAIKTPSSFNRAMNTQVSQNVCQVDTTTVASCAAATPIGTTLSTAPSTVLNHGASGAKQLCKDWQTQFGKAPAGDLSAKPHMPEVLLAQKLVSESFSRKTWPGKTVVVLLPTHHLWTQPPMATGQHALALEVLQPLVASGDITLIDATTMLDLPSEASPNLRSDCASFGDLFHQNDVGREKLMTWLMPRLEQALYR
jgi:hypothetical protein